MVQPEITEKITRELHEKTTSKDAHEQAIPSTVSDPL